MANLFIRTCVLLSMLALAACASAEQKANFASPAEGEIVAGFRQPHDGPPAARAAAPDTGERPRLCFEIRKDGAPLDPESLFETALFR